MDSKKQRAESCLCCISDRLSMVREINIEAQTRDQKRTDMIIDYFGQQYVIELKIWHGDEYNTKGEKQIADYLEEYHLEKGYLLSFHFNKNKKTRLKTAVINGKTVIEAVI